MPAAPKKSLLSSLWSTSQVPAPQHHKQCTTQVQAYAGMTWVDIEDPTKESITKATAQYALDEIHTEQCLQKNQVAQINVEKHYIFLIFYFPYFIQGENRIVTSQVSIFLGHNFLVTLHDSTQRQIVDQLFRQYQADGIAGPKTPGRMLYQLIQYLLKDTAVLIQSVLDEIDEVEESVFKNLSSDAQQIGQLRRNIASLRRTIDIQKSVLEDLDEVIDGFTKEHLARYFTANTKFNQKLFQSIEEARETIEIYKDADFITSTEKTNDILAVLTLLFTLTIPASIFGTIYGMNILLPGGIDSGSWTFLGNFTMLKLMLILSGGSAIVMFAYFRKKKWF